MTSKPVNRTEAQPTTWQTEFLKLLPNIKQHAEFAFRNLDPEAQDDAICEVVASCFCAFRRLSLRGESHRAFASVLVRFAVAQYRAGRRVGSSLCSNDVYSTQAKPSRDYRLCSIDTDAAPRAHWSDCLIDPRRTEIPDQVAFRLDVPRWLAKQPKRNRLIAQRLSHGYTTSEVAAEFELSAGRVSQIRRALAESWKAFMDPASFAPALQN